MASVANSELNPAYANEEGQQLLQYLKNQAAKNQADLDMLSAGIIAEFGSLQFDDEGLRAVLQALKDIAEDNQPRVGDEDIQSVCRLLEDSFVEHNQPCFAVAAQLDSDSIRALPVQEEC